MKTQELMIEGMSCGHCVMSVRKALEQIAGVRVKEVQIGRATVEYDERTVKESDLAAAIRDAGYTIAGR